MIESDNATFESVPETLILVWVVKTLCTRKFSKTGKVGREANYAKMISRKCCCIGTKGENFLSNTLKF